MTDDNAGAGTGDVTPHPGWGATRSKTITWQDPMVTASFATSLSGLDFLFAIRDGGFPPPPMARLMGFSLVQVDYGLAVFECAPDESAYNPIGVVHGGLVCTLCDSAAGCAVQSTLDAGVAYTSIDINVTYLRPITQDSGPIRATGRTTKPGRRVAYATVEVTDGSGKLLAHATSSCLVMENRSSASTA
jgi:uncharacterized protein (TIGR00369 family)